MRRRRDTKAPKFQSVEEERAYWEARGPLAEGHKGRINKPQLGQKRSSFLAVRLTGEELTRLRDMAAKQGLGPSTFARLVLTSAMERQSGLPRLISAEHLRDTVVAKLPHSVKEKADALTKAIAIGDPDNPALLIIDASQRKAWEEFGLSLLTALLASAGVQIMTPENKDYQKVKDMGQVQKG